jgi:SET domain-containing protein
MPDQYTFQPKPFKCELVCQICNYEFPGPNPRCCKVKVCIGIPYCRYHMQKAAKLEIKNSEHGKGVFAKADPPRGRRGTRRTRNNNNRELVFANDEDIIEYGGEEISKEELIERYGKNTGPYAIINNKMYQDGACHRSIGTVINHNGTRPNVEFSQENRRSPITIRAIRNIYNGDQLYADYGSDYEFDENVVSKTIRTRKKGTVEPSKSECQRREANRTRRSV